MHPIDWLFVAVPLGIVFCAGWFARRYMRSVADFVSGGRVAGRYLLAVSRGEMQAGAVVFAAMFEVIGKAGSTLSWWGYIGPPIGVLVAISGFVVYRYRETRAMTMAQFFELRYSKSFRTFTGFLAFFAGIVNFGIIPAVGARFITHFVGLPQMVSIGGVPVETYIIVMGVLLSITLYLTIAGGLVSVMVTDCIEGIISQLLYLVIIVALMSLFRWEQIVHVLADRPPGQSLINPFDSFGLKDFNIWYVLMGICITVYGTMAWQNQSAYNSAGLTPHENRMGNVLGQWRERGRYAVTGLLGLCALTFLNHQDFAPQAAHVREVVGQIANPQIQNQMLFPTAISEFLPVGVKGAFCVILLMGVFGGDSTHLHSWGGIFIQDVLVPLRKKPFDPKTHVRLLRLSAIGVAVFAFLFGIFFRQTEYIIMWWSVTMAIYVGGAGAVIIGGLYWKKGTSAGAWAALIAGSGLSVGGILARQVWGHGFPLNGIQVSFCASLAAIALYVVVSLLTCREDFNMDRMLHRGKYARIKEKVGDAHPEVEVARRVPLWEKMIGIDSNFSVADRWIAGALMGWALFWFAFFVVGTIWNIADPWPLSAWAAYQFIVSICISIFFAVVTAVWFTWGGVRDIIDLFRRLRRERVNERDDGTVVGHRNLDEIGLENSETEGK